MFETPSRKDVLFEMTCLIKENSYPRLKIIRQVWICQLKQPIYFVSPSTPQLDVIEGTEENTRY